MYKLETLNNLKREIDTKIDSFLAKDDAPVRKKKIEDAGTRHWLLGTARRRSSLALSVVEFFYSPATTQNRKIRVMF